jgi:MFS family permease
MFGGIRWGAAFFGWLVAIGIAAIVTAVLAAAGVALGLTDRLPSAEDVESVTAESAQAIGIGGALALAAVFFVAYLAGGYVAGRMARFSGTAQGVAVWIIGLVMTAVAAIAGAVAGTEYNVLSRLDLPRIPIDEGDATLGGVLTLVAVLVVTLLGAAIGGATGERYHRRIDRQTDELVARQ